RFDLLLALAAAEAEQRGLLAYAARVDALLAQLRLDQGLAGAECLALHGGTLAVGAHPGECVVVCGSAGHVSPLKCGGNRAHSVAARWCGRLCITPAAVQSCCAAWSRRLHASFYSSRSFAMR